jgi:hypothetical protein
MSIEKDTGDMVAGALALGMVMNQKSQDAQDANYWHNYALGLQQQLNLQRDISASQDRVIAEKDSKIDLMVTALAEKDQALEATKQELAKQVQYKEVNKERLSSALDDLNSLRTRLMSQSATTRSIDVLYQKLVEDVSRVMDPNALPSFDNEERRRIIDTEMAEWKKTGRLSYVPEDGSGPDRVDLRRKIGDFVSSVKKFQARSELLEFLADSVTRLTDELPRLAPEKAQMVGEYSQRLIDTLNEVRDPATYETLDPVAKLDEVKEEWDSFHAKAGAGASALRIA